ncbi:lysozyme family protein, partial [Niallia circulans]|uniref:C40 family peptidase n=6 Tax=Bacillaceae TaxID=186817 RepID=UPI0039826233
SSKLQPNSTINPSNSKLQLQQSAKKLVSANNSNYSTDGNNAKKLQLQKSQNKLLNADEQTQNKASKLKDVSSNITKQSLKTSGKAVKKGVEKYKQELQREDQAVQVTTNTADSAILVTKKAKTALKNRKLKKATKEELQLQKAKTVLQKTISEDNLTIKKSKEKIKQNKLKKDTKQIDQAKKELKIKNEKLKEKKADLKLVKKEQSKDNFIKKATKPPVSLTTTAIKRGASNYKKQLENGNEGTEVVGKSVSLVKEGTKALSKAKEIRKHKLNQEKLKGISTKLAEGNKKIAIKKSQLNKLKKTDKVQLKKKMIKRKMYASNSEKKKTLSAFSGGIKNLFKNLKDIKGKVSFVALKNLIGQKFAIGAGAVFIKLIPLLLIFLLLFGVIAFFMAGSGGYEEEIKADIGNSIGLSPEVEQWRDLVTREAEAQGMGDYVALILAIIQVESGGKGTRDIMQSSESAGHPPNYFQTEEESVRQGIKYLKGIVMILKAFNAGFENNSKLIAQAYNFGANFANYVGIQGGEYSIDVAETYSRDVVAPSLGNTTGEKYSYVNEVSKSLGKTYLYRNGGNFMYGDLVAQYLSGANGITGDFAIVVAELEKYIGWEYVWGGKSPSTGFDCSGFVSWGLKQIGINLPSYALSQYEQTKPIDPKDAQPGDLIFFKGTYGGANHISHVGFYIDEKTMLDSNGSGVGYHNWKTNYWQKHFAGIRRVVK